MPLSRILFYKIIDVFITFSKTIRTRTLNFKCYIVGSVTDILNTRNIITDVREKVPNLKRFGRHSSIAQSVEHAAVNRRVVGSSPTWGATSLTTNSVVRLFSYPKLKIKYQSGTVLFTSSVKGV